MVSSESKAEMACSEFVISKLSRRKREMTCFSEKKKKNRAAFPHLDEKYNLPDSRKALIL